MTPNQACAIALLAALCWGAGNVTQKTILDHLDPLTAAGSTGLVGALVLLPLARREWRSGPPLPRSALPAALAVAGLFTVATTLLQYGYGLTTVTNGGFLSNTAAVLTPAFGLLFLRQRSSPSVWLACLAALVGIFLMAGGHWRGLNAGDLLALASAAVFAVWTLALGLHVMRHRRPLFLTVLQLAISGISCLVLACLVTGLPSRDAIVAALPEILFMGIAAKGLAYAFMAIAQQHLPATIVGTLVSAEAVFAAMIAAFFLGEMLAAKGLAGASLIVLGIALAANLPAGLYAFPRRKASPDP